MTIENINRQKIIDLLKQDFGISYRHTRINKSFYLEENWVVRYEEFFNPHADPKSFFAEESFDDIDKAVTFFIERIGDTLEEK